MERINIEAYSFRQQNDLLHELEKTITDNGSWIMDHQKFSNRSVSLWVVTDTFKLEKIFNDLRMIELELNDERIEGILMTKLEIHEPESIILSLNINFMNHFSKETMRLPG
jgi:hypothetical protein